MNTYLNEEFKALLHSTDKKYYYEISDNWYEWLLEDLIKFKPKHSQVINERVLFHKTTMPMITYLYPDRVQLVLKLKCHCYVYVDAKLCNVSGLDCRSDEDVKVYTAWSLWNLLEYAMDETTCNEVKHMIGLNKSLYTKN